MAPTISGLPAVRPIEKEEPCKTVLVENYTDGTTLITINRAERRNAICAETALLLQKGILLDFERAPAQKAAVVTGAGDEAFSGGADTGDFPELWRCIPTVGFETSKPIISAVGGWYVGARWCCSTCAISRWPPKTPNSPIPKRGWVLPAA